MLVRGQKCQSNQSTEMSVKSEEQKHVRNYEESNKTRAENTINAIARSGPCPCLQYNVSIEMTWTEYVVKNRINPFKCCAGTMGFCATRLKDDLGQDRKEAPARAVLSQDLFEIVEDCECHKMLLALTICY